MGTDAHVMLLRQPHDDLLPARLVLSDPGSGQVLIRVEACGVCRTDLHLVDGELPQAIYPIVPGHEVVGIVDAVGSEVRGLQSGDRVGVPWLAHTCGQCRYCLEGRENLCDTAEFTGCMRDGGYASHMLAEADYCIRLDSQWSDPVTTAPLLCAGLIGWRALNVAGKVQRLGIYGFGAAAHIITQIARSQGCEVFAFTRPGDRTTQQFARSLGACWAGDSETAAPAPLDASIIFAPEGSLVPLALKSVRKGGRVVCAGIHMSDIPSFPYRLLWEERELVSVANLTRQDAHGFFAAAARADVRSHVQRYALSEANRALCDLRLGRIEGAAVLVPD